ncbi:MAG: O-antigen ligase family protein [Thermoleophilia bacterium]|nr:O-antigen ligase family protein [Thermoleophilia bacterium]
MSVSEITREIASGAAAAGVALLFVPVPRIPPTARRLAGLVLLVAAWAALAATLLPDGEGQRVTDRLTTPAGAAAAVAGIAAVLVLSAVAVRLTLRWPTAWFVALGLALPVRIPVPIGGDDRNLLLPLYVVIAVGAAAFLWGRLRGRFTAADEPSTLLDIPLAAFLVYALASCVWSVDPEEAAVKLVFFYVPFTLLYLVVVALWRHGRALRALAWSTVCLAVPVAVLAVYQYAARDIFLNVRLQQANVYSRFFRSNAIFYDPNILGRYLVVAIVAIVAVAWLRPRPREIVVAVVLLVPLCAGLAVTFSRSSCLMLMLALALMSWRAFGARRTLAVGGATLAVLALGAFTASKNVRKVVTDSGRLEKVSEGRFDLIRGGVEIWQEAPVHGAGLGGFENRYEAILTPAEQKRVRVVISHNTPVTVLSELGAVGFGLFVWLGIRLWRNLADGARLARDPERWAIWTILALVCGILLHALFYAGFFEDPFLWALTAGAMVMAGAAGAVAKRPQAGPEGVPTA